MKKILILFLVLFLVYVVSAEVNYFGGSLVKSYSAGENIKGIINISFEDEDSDSLLMSNFEGEITLKELLDKNSLTEGINYNCSSPGCQSLYEKENSVSNFQISEENNVVGFVISGSDVSSVDSVSLDVSGSAVSSCVRPIGVDVLDDGENILTSSSYVNEICSTTSGCFEENLNSYQLAEIPNNGFYCNKVSLPSAPAYELGARIVNSTSGIAELRMFLFDGDGEELGRCSLPVQSTENQQVDCVVNHASSTGGEFFACVGASGQSNYKIRSETNNACGNNEPGSNDFVRDYDISASSLGFGIIDIKINEENFESTNGISLSNYIEGYISDAYNSECSPECVIPIKFSGSNQNIDFENVVIKYNSGGAILESNEIFEVSKEPAKISSGSLSLKLDEAGFVIPLGANASKFVLSLEGKKIFEEEITISESFNFNVAPKFSSFGENSLFVAVTSENITNSKWTFGDGNIGNSENNQIRHRYLEEGQFTMTVELTNDKGIKSKRSFTIIVGDARESANRTIGDYKERIKDIESEINKFPKWVGDELKEKIDLSGIESSLSRIENVYDSSVNSEDFQKVMVELIELKIPSSLIASQKGNFPFSIGFENINPGFVEEISGESRDRDSLKQSIVNWMSQNYDSDIEFEQIDAVFDQGQETILTRFRIETKPKGNINAPAFLIIGFDKEQIIFMSDYSEKSLSGGTSIDLGSENNNEIFEFLILDDVRVEDLGAYISPRINRLGIIEVGPCNFNNVCEEGLGETVNNCRADCKPTGLATFWIIVLLIGAFAAYIGLQEWYKKYYENYLFKNKDYLYNIINFIYNARKKGLSGKEIRDKLRISRWSKEQISYALKKINGKRTGMYEIPVFKMFENRKVKREIQKRQAKPIDVRFIKRPGL